MTRRKRKKSRKKKGGAGRLLEILAGAVLLMILLIFGASIADRYMTGDFRPTSGHVDDGQHAFILERPDPVDWRNLPTVDIRNGCGVPGLALWMRDHLHGVEFDVLDFRNADRYDYPRTLVRDRSGKSEAASRLRDLLQGDFGVGEVVRDRAEIPEADLVLVLGKDLADTLRRRGVEVR